MVETEIRSPVTNANEPVTVNFFGIVALPALRQVTVRTATGRFDFGVANNSPVCQDEVTTDVLSNNQWYHIVGVYNGTTIFIYQDGVLKESKAVNANCQSINLVDPDRINPDFTSSLDGKLDDVRIYNRALTAAEVQQLYRLGQVTVRQ